MKQYFIAGGAGFIGSHLTRHLLADPANRVTVFDNFSSGQQGHLNAVLQDSRLTIVRGDLKDRPALDAVMPGHDHVYHFASNPDIAKAVTQPDIDFWEGTYLTQNLLEAMRVADVRKLTYASGSGLYGEANDGSAAMPFHEDHAPLLPISTYGASKLAGEAMICSYCHMFDFRAAAFRFANVVGPNQTHGVGYDFVRRLIAEPARLRILGDGSQSKSYVHVDDVVSAMRLIESRDLPGFNYFNVATEDSINVHQVADLVVNLLGLQNVQYDFTGGDRGWKGDVPVIRLDSGKIRGCGWRNGRTTRQAMSDSITAMIEQFRAEAKTHGR